MVWCDGRVLTAGDVRGAAARVASSLPAAGAALNLCEDRYRFLLVFCAAALRGTRLVLPPSRAPRVVAEISAREAAAVVCDDAWVDAALGRTPADRSDDARDSFATIAYTSGSTGEPQAHAKRLDALARCTFAKAGAFDFAVGGPTRWIVATVPPQHLFGLEFSVLLPLLLPLAVHSGRPLLPADVVAAIGSVPAPRVLVTTPLHLRVLVESGVAMPPVERVISATAPLDRALAARAEAAWNCRVTEAFGSTETCAIAVREPTREPGWRPFEGVRLAPGDASTVVEAPWLESPALLHDVLAIRADGLFAVAGRSADLVEVAGKRASIADLTRRLLDVPGVRDAVVVQLEAGAPGPNRVAALVVAPGLRPVEILGRLRESMDPVFLPRPLVIVDAIPRSEVGKATRSRVLELLGRHGPAP